MAQFCGHFFRTPAIGSLFYFLAKTYPALKNIEMNPV